MYRVYGQCLITGQCVLILVSKWPSFIIFCSYFHLPYMLKQTLPSKVDLCSSSILWKMVTYGSERVGLLTERYHQLFQQQFSPMLRKSETLVGEGTLHSQTNFPCDVNSWTCKYVHDINTNLLGEIIAVSRTLLSNDCIYCRGGLCALQRAA